MRFDVLNESTSIFGHRVLEASAGTGKTFAIEHLFLRLLIENNESEPFSISQILVVTFTNAATRELNRRIRENIERALIELQNPSVKPAFPYLTLVQEKNLAIRRLKSALRSYDEANILTIHSFCKRSLIEFAFESNAIIDEEKPAPFLNYVIHFFRHLDASIIHPEQISFLVKKPDLMILYKELAKDLEREIREEPPHWSVHFNEIQKRLKKTALINPQIIKDSFAGLYSDYKISGFDRSSLFKEVDLIANILSKGELTEENFWELAKSGLTLGQFLAKENRKKNAANRAYSDSIDWIFKEIYPLVQMASDQEQIRARLAYFLRKKLDEEESFFNPDENLKRMHLALQKESFVKRIKGKYQAVIIDEFQDTDPLQWDIFSTLFLKPPAAPVFYIVGDPKQSIYGFRRADVYTYLAAAKAMGSENIFHLDTNFRSVPSLIEALNHLFQKANWLSLPKNESYLPYLPVKAGISSEVDFKDGKMSLHFFIGEGQFKRKWPDKEIEKTLLFPFIAKEILALKEKGLSLGQFAVLVKDRFQAKDLEEFLQKRGLPCERKKSSFLSESLALPSLKEFIKAVAEPHNESRVKVALAGPFIGYSLEELLAQKNLPSEPFFALRKKLQTEGIAPFFSLFLQSVWKESVVETLSKDPPLYQDTFELMEYLLAHAHSERLSVEMMEELLEEWEREESEEKKKQFAIDEGGVQILTMHMSKGLEFDVVFALGLSSRSPGEEAEQDAEKLRQLYVAMTRAKKRLYAPILIDKTKKEIEKGSASPMELFLGRVMNHDPYAFKPSYEEVLEFLQANGSVSYTYLNPEERVEEKVNVVKQEPLSEPPPIPTYRKRSYVYSFSGLKRESESLTKEIVAPSSDLPSGSDFGIYVHYLLETLLTSHTIPRELISEVVEKNSHLYPFTDHSEEIAKLIERTLYTPMIKGEEDSFLANIPYNDRLVEVEFFSPFLSHYLKGFIDLVFSYKGLFYLLDWKSNDLGQDPSLYSTENLKRIFHLENYDLQAAIYTDAWKKFIKLVDSRPFEDSFGGMIYVFLRGLKDQKGIYHFQPDLSLLEKISK